MSTLYPKSIDPVQSDGRDIDPALGTLCGEGAQQKTKPEDERVSRLTPEPWDHVPGTDRDDPSYYDVPMLKEPVWEWDIPAYYYLGGTAGAALVLAAAAQLDCDADLRRFIHRCHWIGIIGSSAGGALLVHDLGRPSRFLNMLRVFRPTSPMNIGAWILSGAAPLAIVAGFLNRFEGRLGKVGFAAGYGAGLFGAGLATYTGVLVSNSAIPVWQQSRRVLPILFGASAIQSAASICDLIYEEPRASHITFMFGTAGRVTELIAARALKKEVSRVARVGKPLHHGVSGALWKAATVFTAASLVTSMLPIRNKRKWAGILGTAGSLALRFAVHHAGTASARDARASFRQQRAGYGAAEVERSN